ncbi:AAA-like domain-containing protein [Phormidium tenue FACHB-1052]|uniref:Uncharacterized protein n=1 Tax=Phormidium tenue NIES-30 TaxID=549789 RepID=A0A1U7J602_9CYAN|nr:AAA-like domain-containing protein [Phormidium tenue FACHB-1052]OKH48307.1 hypothetical protein NIES30_09725 [Phormidium tenue NIES-30]
MNKPVVFTTSGTVQAQDGLYLTRQADEELFQLCRRGEYAYILTSRQMGKSSLMVATAERLQGEGVQAAIVDLQRLGAQTTTADKWYFGLLTELARKLRLLPELMTWWEAHNNLGEAQRLVQFLEDVVLPQIPEQLVVFIDEIDSTLSLGFTDDFFIALRYCFTARAENPAFEKLSFVLIGVATPSELITDQKRTPFNIGKLVELQDFTEAETLPLAAGLGLSAAAAPQVLRWILQWTGGHPYLTQRVCEAVVQQPRPTWSAAAVEDLIGELFFGERREQDNNLQFVQSMLMGRAPAEDVLGVLVTYRAVRQGRQPVYDEDQSVVKAHLKLSGIVKRVGAALQVRNPIYARVFDQQWIRKQWPESLWERLKPAIPLIAGLTAGILALGVLSIYALNQRNYALKQEGLASAEASRADESARQALKARDDAQEALEQVEKEGRKALAAEANAKAAKDNALEQRDLALKAREEADYQRLTAEGARQAEVAQRQLAQAAQKRAQAGEAAAITQTAEAQEQTQLANEASQRAEVESFNSEIRAKIFRVEKLMDSDLNFKAWLAALELGNRIRQEEANLQTGNTVTTISRVKQIAKAEQMVALPQTLLRPAVRLQAVAALREIYNYDGYLYRKTLATHSFSDKSVVAFAPDGQILAFASSDGVKLWDKSGHELQTLKGHLSINWVSFSPDSQTIASASTDGTVKLWDRNGRELQTLGDGDSLPSVSGVSFAPDGKTIASASADGTVKLWDISGQELQTLRGHSASVSSVSFAPNGKAIASASADGTVKLWDRQGQELQTLRGHSFGVTSVSFSPDSQTIASASADGTVKLWSRQEQEPKTLGGGDGLPIVSSVSFAPDGKTIANASADGTVKLWDISGQELQTLRGHSASVSSVSFAPNGKAIASASADGTVMLWDRSGRELQALKGHSSSINWVSFSPDSQIIASASYDGTVKLWNTSGRELQTLRDYSSGIRNVSFSPDSRMIASANDDGTVRIWSTSGRELQSLEEIARNPSIEISSIVSFAPNSQMIASASAYGGIMELWNWRGHKLQTLQGHSCSVTDMSFAPDSQTIVSGCDDGTVQLWDVSGREPQILEDHSSRVNGVSFAPDGQTVASSHNDGTVKLWGVNGKKLPTLEGHSASVNSASFAPDSKTIASASSDRTVKLWDVKGWELEILEGHSSSVNSVSFAPDGQTIASADYDGTVIIWNLDLNDLMAKSCSWLRDYMMDPATPTEHKELCKDDLPELADASQPASVSWLNPISSAFTTITEALPW